jgi:hypothetical protein
MASEFDQSDFVDSDYQGAAHSPASGSPAGSAGSTTGANRPPSLEELDQKANDKLQRLAELKQAQDVLERERAALLEARRRRAEFQAGRQEMQQHLTRGVVLLEKVEQTTRRDAEQMTRTLAGLREALANVDSINAENWNVGTYDTELTKALTAIENARMEWNTAQLKWDFLAGSTAAHDDPNADARTPSTHLFSNLSFRETCKLGLAITWPLVVTTLLALLLFAFLLSRH